MNACLGGYSHFYFYMFTKEQVAKWEAALGEVPEFWKEIAVDEPKESIKIAYSSGTNDGTTIKIKFIITSQKLQKKQAFITLSLVNQYPSIFENNEVLSSSITSITSDNMTVELSFKYIKVIFVEPSKALLVANISCNGMSSVTPKFLVSSIKSVTPPPEKKAMKTCYCNRDITVQELKDIVLYMRKNEVVKKNDKLKRDDRHFIIYSDIQGNEIPNGSDGKPLKIGSDGKKIKIKGKVYVDLMQYDLPELKDHIFNIGKKGERLLEDEATYDLFAKEINKAFRNYKITTCLRKIHFFAQSYQETQRFTLTYETNPSSSVPGGDFYRGRGVLHLTGDGNYKEFYKVGSTKEPTDDQLQEFVPKIAEYMKLACQSGGWYWNKVNANLYADIDDADKVSAAVNYPRALTDSSLMYIINGLSSRKLYLSYFKLAMDYEDCKNKK